jgi:hypothetical protein
VRWWKTLLKVWDVKSLLIELDVQVGRSIAVTFLLNGVVKKASKGRNSW